MLSLLGPTAFIITHIRTSPFADVLGSITVESEPNPARTDRCPRNVNIDIAMAVATMDDTSESIVATNFLLFWSEFHLNFF